MSRNSPFPVRLRDLLEEASSAISIYKNPDISDAQEHLNTILTAAGLGTTGQDRITSIDEIDGYFEIQTSWSARCCEQTSDYRVPSSVVDSVNPIQAAIAWRIKREVESAQAEWQKCSDAAERARTRLEAALAAQAKEGVGE